MSGTLYIVGTPIGNLGDFSPRAVQTLSEVDFIAAEDTRVTLKLLNRFEIKMPLISYYEHNRRERGEYILGRLAQGESCALVTDAGMPAISDPGEDLVRLCHETGIPMMTVPGPSAVITALALSGMPSGRFCFEGFLSMNKTSRKEHLTQLVGETRTMVFYEAPHKLLATLTDMLEALGDREISIVRELTKIHEQALKTTLNGAISLYAEGPPKGEIVLVVKGSERPEEPESMTMEQAVLLARDYVEEGMSAAKAAKQAALESGQRKSDIYRLLVSE